MVKWLDNAIVKLLAEFELLIDQHYVKSKVNEDIKFSIYRI